MQTPSLLIIIFKFIIKNELIDFNFVPPANKTSDAFASEVLQFVFMMQYGCVCFSYCFFLFTAENTPTAVRIAPNSRNIFEAVDCELISETRYTSPPSVT